MIKPIDAIYCDICEEFIGIPENENYFCFETSKYKHVCKDCRDEFVTCSCCGTFCLLLT